MPEIRIPTIDPKDVEAASGWMRRNSEEMGAVVAKGLVMIREQAGATGRLMAETLADIGYRAR